MYAQVGDLSIYYEIHGEGEPLILLHGAYMTVDAMAPLLGPLASYRRVIALELQGHGRTADADRPITYEGMADDTAAVLDHLGIEQADVVGYSMGAGVGLQLTVRHPARVRKFVGASPKPRWSRRSPGQLPLSMAIDPGCGRWVNVGPPWLAS